MKIDNSRIFTADIYRVQHTKESKLNGGYGSMKLNKAMVVIKFEKKGYIPVYVPVAYLSNVLKYANFKLNPEKFIGKALQEKLFMPEVGELFVKNVQPLFKSQGKTSLAELIGIQKLQNDKDDTFSGGMELM